MKFFIIILYLLPLRILFNWEIKFEKPKNDNVKIIKVNGNITKFGVSDDNYFSTSDIYVKISDSKLETYIEEYEIFPEKIKYHSYNINKKFQKKNFLCKIFSNEDILKNKKNIEKKLVILKYLKEIFEWNEELPSFKMKNSSYIILQNKDTTYIVDLNDSEKQEQILEQEFEIISETIKDFEINKFSYYKTDLKYKNFLSNNKSKNIKILNKILNNEILHFYEELKDYILN